MKLDKLNFQSIFGKSLWQEDDALPPDRETLQQAIKRLKLDTGQLPELEIDRGDCFYKIYASFIICISYPGNSKIYSRKIN